MKSNNAFFILIIGIFLIWLGASQKGRDIFDVLSGYSSNTGKLSKKEIEKQMKEGNYNNAPPNLIPPPPPSANDGVGGGFGGSAASVSPGYFKYGGGVIRV